MSLEKVDKFFREVIGTKMDAAVFLEPEEVVDAAKEMIALAEEGGKVKITIPFDENGIVNEDNVTVNKEEAEKYVEKYTSEEFDGIYQRCLDFYSDEEGNAGRSLWIETYERVEGSYSDAIDVLLWC